MGSHGVGVKICGIQTKEDVAVINECLPEFAGFVLAPSKRRVNFSTLPHLLKNLDPRIMPVGVFVNADLKDILNAVQLGIGVIQLHGDETVEDVDRLLDRLEPFKIRIWKAIRVIDAPPTDVLKPWVRVDAILLDKWHKERYGGTGEVFDWNIAKKLERTKPLVLAGGLNVGNVGEAIEVVRPQYLDVSSGVRKNGRIEPEWVKEIISCARNAASF
jgi:phosphoribosylanthranilate isomerase